MIRLAPLGTLLGITSFLLQLCLGGKDNNSAPEPRDAAQSAPSGLSTSDWSGIRAAYEAGRHKAFAIDGGYRMRNPGQQWSTQFDERGFLVTPDTGHWTWGLKLKSYGIAGSEKLVSKTINISANGERVSNQWDSNLTEWYKNDARGLEHGFTVKSRPEGAKGSLMLTLSVRGELMARLVGNCDVQFVSASGTTVLNYSKLTVFDTKGKTLPAHFETSRGDLCISIDDTEAHYPITVDPVAQQAYMKASNTGGNDRFGWSVSVSGNTAVVGAYQEDSSATGVNGDQSNDNALFSGAAYVFVRNGGVWSQQAYLKASNTEAFDNFGFSVAISGDTIVVGSFGEDSNSTGIGGDETNNSATEAGAAYVFVRSGTTWSQQAYLKASNTEANDEFGWSVSVSGDTIVVGAYVEDSAATGVNGNETSNLANGAGAAYVFVRNGTTWSQQAYLKASNTEAGDTFGYSVSVSVDTIVVGAYQEDSNSTGVNGVQSNNLAVSSGAVYVFVRSGINWTQQAYLKASNTASADTFGRSVSVSGDTTIAGALGEDSNAIGVNGDQTNNSSMGSGAAYVFVRAGTVWSQQAYLKASNTGTGDEYGMAVAVSGDVAVVGAYAEDSNAIGVDGDGTSNSAGSSGAAYVYVRSGTVWSQQAYLKASNTGTGDQFGRSVAVSGDIVAVGAQVEDSNSIGINGDQSSNTALDSGALYMFDLDNNPGTLSYGTGTPGCAGTHTLDVTHAPMINSPNFAITCSNAPAFSMGLGIVSDSQDLAGSDSLGVGVLIHSDLIFATELLTFDFFSDGTGYSETVGAIIPNNPVIVGSTYYASALWAWPLATCVLPGFNPYNLSTSRGLALTILTP